MSQFEHFVKVLSLYLEARIWIRNRSGIKGQKGRTRIRIRFRINVMRIRNTGDTDGERLY